jgi:soluble lytic murein transglycosylase-like protein
MQQRVELCIVIFVAWLVLGLYFFVTSVPAFAAESSPEIEQHVSEACERWKVPQKLVWAIMAQESGHNSWAVNVGGKGYMPKSNAEYLAIADAAFAAGKSFDVGLMQINSYWLRRFDLTPEYVIDPRRNIIIGTWILSKEIARHGLGWKAVASYHTPVDLYPERGRAYAASVIGLLREAKE